ncbi:MAG: DinB family protein, partial [Actinomycetota bacterium]|nr:DinB family protein [Actinomycetota bacterium]
MQAERPYPPRSGDEREILESYLDWYRETLLIKVNGLSDADMKRRLVTSETTLFGIVHHLAYVERWWFQDVFAGRRVEYPWRDEDPDADWHVEGSISSDEAIA